jgi:hypothetical protein
LLLRQHQLGGICQYVMLPLPLLLLLLVVVLLLLLLVQAVD